MTRLIVGAYPVYIGSDEAASACVAALAERDDVGGFELPYSAAGLVVPPGCPGHWRHVVTCIPATMVAMGADPAFGLASPDPDGRAAAVRAIATVRADIERLALPVQGVEIHSAPRRTGTTDAFAMSLAEITAWDWDGIRLVVEHCDTWREDLPVQKGFLSLDSEIAVVSGLRDKVSLGVNWARSVIETRDAATGAGHVAKIAAAGCLGSVMFSSVSDADSFYGPAWDDSHLPPAGTGGAGAFSLLTQDRIAETLAAAGDSLAGAMVGLKVGIQPSSLPIGARVAQFLEIVDMVSHLAAQ